MAKRATWHRSVCLLVLLVAPACSRRTPAAPPAGPAATPSKPSQADRDFPAPARSSTKPSSVSPAMEKLLKAMDQGAERGEAATLERPLDPPRRRPFKPSPRGYYWLLQPDSPWGDYGDMLIQGMGAPEGIRGAGALRLRRTGPYVPPLTFPAMTSAVVTATLRHQLEAAALSGLVFAPVLKERIIKVDWRGWDQTHLPPQLLRLMPNGEPEEILEGTPSKQAASAMEELWELVPKRFDQPPVGVDVLRIGAHIVVSKRAFEVLSRGAATWFDTAPIEDDPSTFD